MPHSYPYFKQEVKEFIQRVVPKTNKILDVGPGEGTYADLLSDYKMDCVEIYAPYIEKYKLSDKYNKVINDDIINIDLSEYDFIILGDILEHLNIRNAQKLIYNIINLGKTCMVAVPYMMEQGAWGGNEHETHLQPDLTPEVMKQRYPSLKLIYSNNQYGYYFGSGKKLSKAFVLYANEAYADLAETCVASLNKHSKYPVYVYMLDSDVKVKGAVTFRWESQALEIKNRKDFIDRDSPDIYKLLIERPAITKHALQISELVCYVDCDSIATKYVDSIFDYYDEYSTYPYFVEGIYDWLTINGRGGAESYDDLSTTLEYPACELFGVNQYVRKKYRQTGYYVAGRNTIDFLEEWYYMCNHPKIMKNHTWYAPYHEETICNVLLYKMNAHKGLPYVYINGLRKVEFTGEEYHLDSWVRVPATESKLLFYHGEKNIQKIKNIINEDTLPC
jgi:hypothetical protein